jgi:hypothetical protein
MRHRCHASPLDRSDLIIQVRPSRRGMAVSRRGSIPPPTRSIGSHPIAAIQANPASPTSRPWSRSIRAPNTPTAAAPTRAFISPQRRSISSVSPGPHAAIGASKACTGCSTSSSKTIFPASAPAMAPKTWLSCGASRSISCVMERTKLGIALDVEDCLPELGAHLVHGFKRVVLEDFSRISSQRFSFGLSSGE